MESAANQEGGSSRIGPWLSSFSCEKDSDIADYLQNRAVKFETLGKSRTYLVCDRDVFFNERDLHIYGFFTVALKVLDLPENLSNRKRLELDGFSSNTKLR